MEENRNEEQELALAQIRSADWERRAPERFVLAFFALVIVVMLLASKPSDPPPPIKRVHAENLVVVPIGRQLIHLSYRIRLDTAYTGAETYIQYTGRETQEVTYPRQVATTGLPVNRYGPPSTEILFTRFNGEECRLLVPVTGVVARDSRRMVPAAEYGAVGCPSKRGLFYLRLRVNGLGSNFTIFAAPSEDELREMV